jgi:putative aminopeptidase FrvX
MHTPVEVVSVKDVTRAGRLMAEFIVGLNDETLNKLTLD